jgi:hypothetical protein
MYFSDLKLTPFKIKSKWPKLFAYTNFLLLNFYVNICLWDVHRERRYLTYKYSFIHTHSLCIHNSFLFSTSIQEIGKLLWKKKIPNPNFFLPLIPIWVDFLEKQYAYICQYKLISVTISYFWFLEFWIIFFLLLICIL